MSFNAKQFPVFKLNSFYRRRLRRKKIIAWIHKISNETLYEVINTNTLSVTFAESRWKLLGHILKLTADFPAGKAKNYYFKERTNTRFATTTNSIFIITSLNFLISLQNICTKAINWSKVVSQEVNSAYSR